MKAPVIRAPTGRLSRQVFKWLGAFVLLLNIAFLAVFGTAAFSDPGRLAQLGGGMAGGVLLILSTVELPWSVEWYRLAGLGCIFLAVSFLLTNVLARTDLWWIAVNAVGAFSLAFFGFDMIRGGRHFRVDVDA